MKQVLLVGGTALFALLISCSEEAPTDRDSGPEGDGATELADGAPPAVQLTWNKTSLDRDRAGKNAAIAINGSTMGVAYYRELEDDVVTLCPASGVSPAGEKPKPANDLFYVHYDGTDWGTPVKVDQNIGAETYGLSLIFDGAGAAKIGYLGGEVGVTTCDSSDALIATSSDGANWSDIQTLASAGPFAGDTVGVFMTLARDSAGQVHAAYGDVRFGYYEHDGEYKASLLYDSGEAVAEQNGAGVFNSMAFDQADRPVIAYFKRGSKKEIMLAIKEGQQWTRQQLRGGDTAEKLSLATDGQGNFGLAFFDPVKQALSIMESSGDLSQWTTKIVDPNLTNNGKFASMAYDSKGNPGISYYRCGKYGGGPACDLTQDGLMFAYRVNGRWSNYTVDTGDTNMCGTYTSLVFDANDEPVIAYQCVGLNAEKQFIANLKVAHGKYK